MRSMMRGGRSVATALSGIVSRQRITKSASLRAEWAAGLAFAVVEDDQGELPPCEPVGNFLRPVVPAAPR
jgi:hypothetical protein